ncbi:MAG: sulfurtransferase TusA family protein [Rhodospirillales bacterium]|nr:sulfurtransferase TusA family protein [Rhodospirillales bacterium]
MHNSSNNNSGGGTEFFLDITSEMCPMTFVRTKLLIERMAPGAIAEIRLSGAEPLRNVPRSVSAAGHTVLSLVAENADAGPAGTHRLRIQKA